MRIWRSRAPVRLTSPTPSTVSSTRLICLSAISVVSRRLRSPATTTESTGSASGSAFWMTGGRMLGGRSRKRPRHLLAHVLGRALDVALEHELAGDARAAFGLDLELSSSMPLMVDSASSSGSTTWVVISSGVAPGQVDGDVDGGGIGAREEIDAEVAEREDAQHDQERDQHHREHGRA